MVDLNGYGVLFRNNHFSTLFKKDGKLYSLISDAGFVDEPTVVWEHYCSIDGNNPFCRADFTPRKKTLEKSHESHRMEGLEVIGCIDVY